MNRFIAIDLEIEQPFTRPDTTDSKTDIAKLIQIGIVVFEIAEAEPTILHSETMNISYSEPLSQFIKTLTSITDEDVNDSVLHAIHGVERIRELQQQYDTSRQIVEWGSGDVTFLLEEAGISQETFNSVYGFARSTINTKVVYQLYAMMNGKKRQGGLSTSMAKVGLQFKGTRYNGKNKGKHWAEADALNTARIFNTLCNLYKRNVITVSDEAFDQIQKKIDNPSPPNEKLLKAMKIHNKNF
jgi:inhibitor of KinA sporulation pathway (predicted exonuclease)